MKYPGGDLPMDQGVCTDVVVRALRKGAGLDLQRLVHEDMAAHFSAYPRKWGRKTPDRNIDHRRVPNLAVFFNRSGWRLPSKATYLPGDLVTVVLPGGRDHIMVVSDHWTAKRYLVIHNIGEGAKEEDCLASFRVVGHFRVKTNRRAVF
jgi:uncharacterized protein YijF (DUF1287 family)